MFSKDRVNLRRKSNKLYISIVIFMLVGMTFFLTTRFIFEEKINVLATPINQEIEVSSSNDIKIYEWIYDEEKKQMQLIIETDNLINEYENILFEAFQRSDGGQINVESIYQDNGIYVLRINDFNSNYEQIALDIIGEKEPDEMYNNESEEMDKNKEKELDKSIIKTLFTDQRVIDKEPIKNNSKNNIIRYVTNIMIENINGEIDSIKEEINMNNEEIEERESRINSLTEEKIYQTDEEKIETDSNINSNKIEIDNLEEINKKFKNDIQRLNDKIEKIRQKEREKIIKNDE